MSSNCTFDIFLEKICENDSNKYAMPYKRRKLVCLIINFRIILQFLITMRFLQLNQEKSRLYFEYNSNDAIYPSAFNKS